MPAAASATAAGASAAAQRQSPGAAAHRTEAHVQQQSQLLKLTCARLAAVGVHDASATVSGCQLRKQLCVQLLGGTGPDGVEVDALELGFQHACRLLPEARTAYMLIGPQPAQRQEVHFSTTAGLALRSGSEFTAFRRALGIARGSYVAVATCAEPAHLHVIVLMLPEQPPATPQQSEQPARSPSATTSVAGTAAPPPPMPPAVSTVAAPAQPPPQTAPPTGASVMASPVRLPPPMARPAAANTPPATGRGPPSPAQTSRACTGLALPAAPPQQGQWQEGLRWLPPLSKARPTPVAGAPAAEAALPVTQPRQSSTAAVAERQAAQSPARSTVLQLQCAPAAAPAPQAPAERPEALQSLIQRQPTAQATTCQPPAQVITAAAAAAAATATAVASGAVIPPTEVAHALWLLATQRQQLAGRSVVVQLQTSQAANGKVVEMLKLSSEQVSFLLPDVPPHQLPATLLTTKGTPCVSDLPGGRYISGFADFRKAAGVRQGACVKVQAINGRLPWLLVTSASPVPPAQQPPTQPAAAAAAPPAIAAPPATAVPLSSPLSPRYSMRQGSASGNLTQLNAAAGKCWLRRQLRVRLGGGGSPADAAADAAADASAAAMPLLSVPAADVRGLLHPYARCSRYTLVSNSGVEREVAFGGGGSNGGGDMCSSDDGELASFLQAAGISAGSSVSIAVCNDMQHLHISQLHQSPHRPPASATAAARTSAAAPEGELHDGLSQLPNLLAMLVANQAVHVACCVNRAA